MNDKTNIPEIFHKKKVVNMIISLQLLPSENYNVYMYHNQTPQTTCYIVLTFVFQLPTSNSVQTVAIETKNHKNMIFMKKDARLDYCFYAPESR